MFDLIYIVKRLNKTYEGCGFINKEVLYFMQYKRCTEYHNILNLIQDLDTKGRDEFEHSLVRYLN